MRFTIRPFYFLNKTWLVQDTAQTVFQAKIMYYLIV